MLSFYFRGEVLPYYGGSVTRARDIKGCNHIHLLGAAAPQRRRGAHRFRLRAQQARHGPLRLQETLRFRALAAALRVRPGDRRRTAGPQPEQPEVPAAGKHLAAAAAAGRQSTRAAPGPQPGLMSSVAVQAPAGASAGVFARRAAAAAFPLPPHPLPAQQGRQDPRLSPASSPCKDLCGTSGHLRRRSGRLGAGAMTLPNTAAPSISKGWFPAGRWSGVCGGC